MDRPAISVEQLPADDFLKSAHALHSQQHYACTLVAGERGCSFQFGRTSVPVAASKSKLPPTVHDGRE
jgi:hypothetical protein